MHETGPNIFDIAAGCAVIFAARAGYRQGFAKTVWSMLRWGLVLGVGTLTWAPLGEELTRLTGLAPNLSALACYITVGAAILFGVAQAQHLLGKRLLLAIPPGAIDGFFGSLAGAGAVGALALVIYAMLSPFEIGEIDWHPVEMKTEDSVEGLGRAIFGSVRQAALDESWLGRTLQEHWSALLIPPSGHAEVNTPI